VEVVVEILGLEYMVALCYTSAERERQNIDSLVLPFVTGLID